MPGYRIHNPVGQVSGGITSIVYITRDGGMMRLEDFIAESFGGIVGGGIGALLPDIIEPAIHSWHRSFAHSYAAGTAMIVKGPQLLNSWRNYCLRQSEYHEQLSIYYQNHFWLWLKHWGLYIGWRFLRGLVPGAVGGYGSHLLLDAGTPRGLPLLTF